jgi:tRNA-specific 2-thiouridylase
VLGTDPASNTVTVGPRTELLTRTVHVRDVTLHRDGDRVDAIKVRYRGERVRCRLATAHAPGEHPAIEVQLAAPAERTAPGQIACLYDGDRIVGHGTIASPSLP